MLTVQQILGVMKMNMEIYGTPDRPRDEDVKPKPPKDLGVNNVSGHVFRFERIVHEDGSISTSVKIVEKSQPEVPS